MIKAHLSTDLAIWRECLASLSGITVEFSASPGAELLNLELSRYHQGFPEQIIDVVIAVRSEFLQLEND
ncbi:hypothetical protein C7413_126107 [Paraburkholderia silvatlantica]|nr:hypothetical protein C7411_127107 [Paraburkholderia silvatlantica]PXW31214.1 hypothetical protein C7413_126107 [Paraburkholderia silvatlantica]